MRRNKRKNDAIGILFALLFLPLIVYWREIIIICIVFLIATIIYKCIKTGIMYKGKNTYHCSDVVIAKESYERDNKSEYEEYLKDKYVQKGIEAEEKIIKILERIFPSNNIIHDSYFRDDELVTTQVDIIAINTSGIYVIESKAYSSIIAGKTNEKLWVQLFSGKKYRRFSNPIIQNTRHINAIKNNLKEFGVPKRAFKSYIVFDNNCKLDIETIGECSSKVLQQKYLFYDILENMNTTKDIITAKQVEDIARRLRAHANVDESLKMDHIVRRKNNVKYEIKGR